jgi:hypothetical protein
MADFARKSIPDYGIAKPARRQAGNGAKSFKKPIFLGMDIEARFSVTPSMG